MYCLRLATVTSWLKALWIVGLKGGNEPFMWYWVGTGIGLDLYWVGFVTLGWYWWFRWYCGVGGTGTGLVLVVLGGICDAGASSQSYWLDKRIRNGWAFFEKGTD